MPVIFDDATRSRIRQALLESGFQSLKKYGLKRTSIEEIAGSSGIAKGTFYNFFSSKEEFVAEIIRYKREQSKQEFAQLFNGEAVVEPADLSRFIKKLFLGGDNPFTFLKVEELAVLATRVPGFVPDDALTLKTTETLLSFIPNKKPDCDPAAVANYMRILMLIGVHRENFLAHALDKNIEAILANLTNEIFVKE